MIDLHLYKAIIGCQSVRAKVVPPAILIIITNGNLLINGLIIRTAGSRWKDNLLVFAEGNSVRGSFCL